MLALIENEIVSSGWITEHMFTDIVAISQMTPGPIGINSATYIGYVAPGVSDPAFASPLYGVLGALLCTLVVVLPSFILVRYTGHYITRHRDNPVLKGIFKGLRPVIIGLIASAALLLMNGANFGTESVDIVKSIVLAAVALCVVLFTKVHPILIIICAGIAGLFLF